MEKFSTAVTPVRSMIGIIINKLVPWPPSVSGTKREAEGWWPPDVHIHPGQLVLEEAPVMLIESNMRRDHQVENIHQYNLLTKLQ